MLIACEILAILMVFSVSARPKIVSDITASDRSIGFDICSELDIGESDYIFQTTYGQCCTHSTDAAAQRLDLSMNLVLQAEENKFKRCPIFVYINRMGMY